MKNPENSAVNALGHPGGARSFNGSPGQASGVFNETCQAQSTGAQGLLEQTTGIREGTIISGKYRIDGLIGTGGMGVVVAARHLQLDQTVAIKLLRPEVLDKAEIVHRFAREARAAVRIQSEHVARILDVGALETGQPYIVMEFLQGSDLSAWIQQRGALPTQQAVEFVLQASEAIAEAHGLGIVHRDLKPANLFCIRASDGRPSIKVLDFGVSKVSGRDGATGGMGATQAAVVLGSPHYMSPEQMQSAREVDNRSDIWSLGIILYELLTGDVPFPGESLAEVCAKVVSRPPPPLRNTRADVPRGLEDVIAKCLEKDRKNRYANVAEFASALAPFGPVRTKVSVERISRVLRLAESGDPSMIVSSSNIPFAESVQPGAASIERPARRRRLLLGAGIGLAGVGVLVAAMLLSSRPQEQRSKTSFGLAYSTPHASTSLPVPDVRREPEAVAVAAPAASASAPTDPQRLPSNGSSDPVPSTSGASISTTSANELQPPRGRGVTSPPRPGVPMRISPDRPAPSSPTPHLGTPPAHPEQGDQWGGRL